MRALLTENGLTGFAKTSGSRGIHVNVPIHPRWTFTEVRRAALALSRAVERRLPALASSRWWKEERHGVFLDYNQNAKDRTTASAYSVRPLPDARVSAPLRWEEVPECDPGAFTVLTMPARFAAIGDPHADFARNPGSLESLLQLAARDEAEGLGDAPWPPHFAKGEGEGPRVAPSRAKKASAKSAPTKSPRVRMPLVTIANSPDKEAALAGLETLESRLPRSRRPPRPRRYPRRPHARPSLHLVPASASTCAMSPKPCALHNKPPTPTTTPPAHLPDHIAAAAVARVLRRPGRVRSLPWPRIHKGTTPNCYP